MRKSMFAAILVVAAFLLPALAMAQGGVLQGGAVAPGHVASWAFNGIIRDAGPATNGVIREIGITNPGLGLCQNNAAIATNQAQICSGFVNGIPSISVNGAVLDINLNGAIVPITAAGPGKNGSFSILPPTTPVEPVANTPLEGIYLAGGGSLVDLCPVYNFGCPSVGKIRGQSVNFATTLGDAGTQESGIYSYMVDNTGVAHPWATSVNYTAGTVTINAGGANLYRETAQNCTSAASGPGPLGTNNGIADNSCLWDYAGQPGLAGKIAIASTILVNPGGGRAWAGAFDTYIEPGWNDIFSTGIEIDMTNNSGTDAYGYPAMFLADLYLGGQTGSQPITTYVSVSPFATNGANYMAHDGIWFQGQYTIKDHDIEFSTGSVSSIFDNGAHATSSYYDASTSPVGIYLQGNYANAALDADNTLYVSKTVQGADFSGLEVLNPGTGSTTDANINMTTGTTGSYLRLDLFDGYQGLILSGPANTAGMTIATYAGPINLNAYSTVNSAGTISVSKTVSGGDFTGLAVLNPATGALSDANITLTTGTAGSYGRLDVFDTGQVLLLSGASNAGLTIASNAGPININPHTTIYVGGVAGVSCVAPPTAGFLVNDGIVTHC